jgi:putative ABC transport system ATP-binding protein
MEQFSLKEVTKTYGKGSSSFQALKGISLNINKGKTIAIIGKSGSGKSTMMHLLAALDTPTTGEIKFEGKLISSMMSRVDINKLRNETFGFVFQQFFLNGRDTVGSNVELPLKIAGIPFWKRKEMVEEVLKKVGLGDKIKNRANDLSGGQKQRVCIARALVNNPKVIFADEPTGNLDTVTGEQITDLLFDLNKSLGITLIFVTHDDDLAKRCEEIIKIADGKIVKE